MQKTESRRMLTGDAMDALEHGQWLAGKLYEDTTYASAAGGASAVLILRPIRILVDRGGWSTDSTNK
nr:hypothetical protein CFP56_63106 [Quercus suber]